MNSIELYTKAQALKRISRKIQFLSYSLNKLETKFPIDKQSDDDLVLIIEEYEKLFEEFQNISIEINTNSNTNSNENTNNTHQILG